MGIEIIDGKALITKVVEEWTVEDLESRISEIETTIIQYQNELIEKQNILKQLKGE
jgi:hypothetical protein